MSAATSSATDQRGSRAIGTAKRSNATKTSTVASGPIGNKNRSSLCAIATWTRKNGIVAHVRTCQRLRHQASGTRTSAAIPTGGGVSLTSLRKYHLHGWVPNDDALLSRMFTLK